MKLASALILCFALSAQQPALSLHQDTTGHAEDMIGGRQYMISGMGPGPAPTPADSFTVEKLTPTELKEYQAARAKLDEVEGKIKAGHGETSVVQDITQAVIASCGPRYSRSVEILGNYALVTVHEWNPCGGATIKIAPEPFPK